MPRCVLFDIDNTLLLKKPSIAEKVFEAASPLKPGLTMAAVEQAYAQSELWQGSRYKGRMRPAYVCRTRSICKIYSECTGTP